MQTKVCNPPRSRAEGFINVGWKLILSMFSVFLDDKQTNPDIKEVFNV
jgi:hypothetical protein